MNRKIILIVPIIALIITILILYFALVNDWMGLSGTIGLNYCEHSRDALIKQPANTYSNIAFIIAGFIIAWNLMTEKYAVNKNRLTTTLFYPVFFSTLCVLMGPCSMAMHASTTIIGGYIDVMSMYLLASFMFAYASIRLNKLSESKFFSLFLIAVLICNIVYFYKKTILGWIDSNTIFGVFIVTATLLEFVIIYRNKIEIQKKWAFLFSATFLLSFTIWNLSKTGNMLCDEYSLIQGHAIWHILDAITLYFMFRYYVSENILIEENGK